MLDVQRFTERLRYVRHKSGLTQYEVAELIHTHNSHIANFETQRKQMSVFILRKLCYLYDVSMDYLLGVDSEPWYTVFEDCLNSCPYEENKPETQGMISYVATQNKMSHKQASKIYQNTVRMSAVSYNAELSKTMLNKVIGERLELCWSLKGKHLGMEEVCKCMNMNATTIRNHRKGVANMHIDYLYRYALFYEMPTDFIAGLVD